ncbi:hypothetical protein BBP40_003894 [Aspergillus hancockii]|nr:hypothetical protein BBP40_003894 [Aspergillus hancockii]
MFTSTTRRISALPPKLTRTILPRHHHHVSTFTLTRPTSTTTSHLNSPRLQSPILQQKRPLSTSQKWTRGLQAAKTGIWRKNPILLPLALLSLATATALFTYIAYIEYTRVAPQYHKFPPPVAESLRTAVYYTEVDLNPPKALAAYKEALRIALEMGMHPFSDEVLGIKLQVAFMLEKAGLVKASVEVLERSKGEVLSWVEAGRDGGKEMKRKGDVVAGGSEEERAEAEQKRMDMEAYEERQRDKALKKAVGMEMKLAELYSSDYMQDEKKAETAQVAAVELCLKEMNRRQKLGLAVGGGTQDNDAWLNVEEIATALSDLAGRYTGQEKHDLALPLYLRALELLRVEEGDSPSCKQVVLLNDVASAMAGQAQKPIRAVDPKKARDQLADAARQWAQKSIDVAARIQPPFRDQECDVSCVAATYNLGELAELQGKPKEAEKRYIEARSLAQGLSFEEGIAMADSALKRITKK